MDSFHHDFHVQQRSAKRYEHQPLIVCLISAEASGYLKDASSQQPSELLPQSESLTIWSIFS